MLTRSPFSTKRSRLLQRLALLSALSPALFPARAGAADNEWSTGGGVFLGYAFGSHEGVVWGLEAFSMRLSAAPTCSPTLRSGLGPLVQVSSIGLSSPRITLALQGGAEIAQDQIAISAELGGTYRFGTDPGFGVHLGFAPQWSIFNVAMRGELFLNDISLAAGARYEPTFGTNSNCAFGRPLRAKRGLVEVAGAGHRSPVEPTCGEASAAGRAWERDAQYECASVPAFLQLARELLAHDAPLALVERALDAASDEIRHTRLCADVASGLLGIVISPSSPEVSPRPTPSLVELATESWLDGCLGEGAAAARAGRARRLARHGGARRALVQIERDEGRHAELAWDVLQWAFERGGDDARDAVRSLPLAAPSITANEEGPLEPYGQLRAVDAAALFEQHAFDCVQRRDARLGGGSRGSTSINYS